MDPGARAPGAAGSTSSAPRTDDAAILEILQRIFLDVMDQGIRLDVDRLGVERAAEEELAFFKWLPGPRTWWRVAHTPTGEPAGLTIPSRNYGGPQIGFVGVVPGQRGHGYGYELLAESTHLLADAGADRITATTDTTNAPMSLASLAPATPSRAIESCSPTGRRADRLAARGTL